MAFLVNLPPLGEGIFEAQMIAVHKKVGDSVKEGDVIAEMETDKATGVLASPVSGTIDKFYIGLGDYIFRNEKVLLIDDGKEELTTGSGADGGRVSADGKIVAPPLNEVLATSINEQNIKKQINKREETIIQVPKLQKIDEELKESSQLNSKIIPQEQSKEVENDSVENGQTNGKTADNETMNKPEDGEFIAAKDGNYYIVNQTGGSAEIFARFYGKEKKPVSPTAKPDMDFMLEQGQAQQGKPVPNVEYRQRYLDPLQSNFQHSLDGSQPIPTHIANELSYDELLAKGENVKIIPALRKYAAEQGIDVSLLPVDDNGVVTKEIIDLALSHRVGEREWNYRLINENDPGYWTHRASEEQGREETYIRKYNASRFEMSHHKAPPYSVHMDVDMTKLTSYLNIIKGDKVTNNTFISYYIKAICLAAYRYPELNSTIDDVLSVFRFKNYVNVGIEMNTVQGLFTPVVKDAHSMTYDQLEERINELEHEVKVERIFNYETNSESTITISDLTNLGLVEGYNPIIQYPNAAIFGIAGVRDKAVVIEGQIEVRPMNPISLVMDARILTRDKGVRILTFIKDMLENPSYLFEMEKQLFN